MKMSTKVLKKSSQKSKVSVNNVISSEEDIESDVDSDHMKDEFDGSGLPSDDDIIDSDSEINPANSGWADAINKVLSVQTKNKSMILSKAKKDKDYQQKSDDQNDGLEFVKSDGTLVKSSDNKIKKQKTNEKITKKKKNKSKLNKHEWELLHKLKPKEEDREKERYLSSIATKGVVQLFNAVREQQKTIETKIKEIGTSETKRDKMLSQFNKNQFLDKLKQNNKDNKNTNNKESEQKEEQKWKVLRDDFMVGKRMKDWDKDSDSQESDH